MAYLGWRANHVANIIADSCFVTMHFYQNQIDCSPNCWIDFHKVQMIWMHQAPHCLAESSGITLVLMSLVSSDARSCSLSVDDSEGVPSDWLGTLRTSFRKLVSRNCKRFSSFSAPSAALHWCCQLLLFKLYQRWPLNSLFGPSPNSFCELIWAM